MSVRVMNNLPPLVLSSNSRHTDLNDGNFLMYAMKYYDNPHCHDITEFQEDLSLTVHLKKLFTRYQQNNVLKERLIINHIICFFNVFENFAAAKILFYKMDKEHYQYLKTFLTYLNRCPDVVEIKGNIINLKAIPNDDILLYNIKENLKLSKKDKDYANS